MTDPPEDSTQSDVRQPAPTDEGTMHVAESAGRRSERRTGLADDPLIAAAASQAHAPLLRLLAQPPDVVIDQLCEGQPWDLAADCDAHVALNAYFIEPGRVAARAIATLSTLSYTGEPLSADLLRQLSEAIETLIPEATADVIDEGPLERTLPGERRCPLTAAIGRVLGIDDVTAHGLIGTLNSLGFDDRHVFFHCIVRSMTPEAYANRFHEDPRVVSVMLRNLAKLAIDEGSD